MSRMEQEFYPRDQWRLFICNRAIGRIRRSKELCGKNNGGKKMEEQKKKKLNVDFAILIPCMAILIILCVCLIVKFDESQTIINNLLSFIEYKLGWLYIIVMLISTGFSLWLCFGKCAKLRMCAPGEKAPYSLFSWFSMLFFTTMASSIMVMPFINVMDFISEPIFGIEAMSAEAFEWSSVGSVFIYGPHGYSFYAIFAVGVAFVVHYKKSDKFKVSEACIPVIGGVCTSFGLAVPVVVNGICSIFNIQESFALTVGVLIAWTVVFGTSVVLGLEKGIRRLSNINAVLVFVFVILIILFGPTFFIIKYVINSLGLTLDNYVRLMFWTDPIETTGYVEGTNVFFYAWFIGFATTVGTFLGKISKGRSVREIVVGTTLAISACCWIIIPVFGGFSVWLQDQGIIDIPSLLEEYGQNATIIQIVGNVPIIGPIMVILHTVLLFTFIATTLDSTAFNLASMTSKKLAGDEEPALPMKFMWVIIILTVTAILQAIGGLSAVQVTTVVASLPMIIVLGIMIVSTKRMLKTVK